MGKVAAFLPAIPKMGVWGIIPQRGLGQRPIKTTLITESASLPSKGVTSVATS